MGTQCQMTSIIVYCACQSSVNPLKEQNGHYYDAKIQLRKTPLV